MGEVVPGTYSHLKPILALSSSAPPRRWQGSVLTWQKMFLIRAKTTVGRNHSYLFLTGSLTPIKRRKTTQRLFCKTVTIAALNVAVICRESAGGTCATSFKILMKFVSRHLQSALVSPPVCRYFKMLLHGHAPALPRSLRGRAGLVTSFVAAIRCTRPRCCSPACH